MTKSSTRVTPKVHYPDSDGQPMGETGLHVLASMDLFSALKFSVFLGRPDVYVAADMFFYFEEGNPDAVKAPDVMVIKGVDGTFERRSFKLWVEKQVPCVVFEVTSPKSRRDDTVDKLELYARLGIQEYFLFDPLREYLKPQLQGYRLEAGRYVRLVADAEGSLESQEIGLKLRAVGRVIGLFDSEGPIYNPFGKNEKTDKEHLKALRDDLSRERKIREKIERKAKRDAAKLEAERKKAEALEAELKRLRALLDEQGSGQPS